MEYRAGSLTWEIFQGAMETFYWSRNCSDTDYIRPVPQEYRNTDAEDVMYFEDGTSKDYLKEVIIGERVIRLSPEQFEDFSMDVREEVLGVVDVRRRRRSQQRRLYQQILQREVRMPLVEQFSSPLPPPNPP